MVLCVAILSMSLVGYSIAKLGSDFFNAVSRNPVVGDKISTTVLILATMIELFGLIMTLICLYIVFVK